MSEAPDFLLDELVKRHLRHVHMDAKVRDLPCARNGKVGGAVFGYVLQPK